jgi:hypothetical protein
VIGKSTAEFHKKVLGKLEKLWDANMLPALFQSVRFCQEAEIVLPEWAARDVLQMIQDEFHDMAPRRKQGRTGSIKNLFQMNYAHYLRWNAYSWAMALSLADPKKRGAPKKGTVPRDRILKEARSYLKGRLARNCSDEEIAKSYRTVEKSRKAGELTFAFDDLYYPLE